MDSLSTRYTFPFTKLPPLSLPRLSPPRVGGVGSVFGSGGFQFKLTGSAELGIGLQQTQSQHPQQSLLSQRKHTLSFSEQIQAGLQASLGSKLKLQLNYNTASTFSTDAKSFKLSFTGDKDDAVKLIELGNVALQPRNSLIQSRGALLGLHSKLQFGKLSIDMLLSQQRTQRRRIASQQQTKEFDFEVNATDYDVNRHFFLSSFFRHNYESALNKLPQIHSPIQITRIELWVTNRSGRYNDARNIIALSDLGEEQYIHNQSIIPSGQAPSPHNNANSLYPTLTSIPQLRQSLDSEKHLDNRLHRGQDYEILQSARRLSPHEYILNERLGFISLQTPLGNDDILAVALEYSYEGKTFRIGEFATERPNDNLFLKLLKGGNSASNTPYWSYMMRNVYSLGRGISSIKNLRLNFLQRQASGIALPHISNGRLQGQRLLNLLGLDQIDAKGERNSDGLFDFLEGVTLNSTLGVIYIPKLEPFGSNLQSQGAEQELVFAPLYQQAQTSLLQHPLRNTFLLRGSYQGSNRSQIYLGSNQVSPGSVQVQAGGETLTEDADYSVDYLSGIVTITNQKVLNSNTSIGVSVDEQEQNNRLRRTLLGIDLGYQFSPELELGATAMYLNEVPLSSKTLIGQERLQNFIWGANLIWRHQSTRLTEWLNKLPLLKLKKPSQINFDVEFAQLTPHIFSEHSGERYSILDDFETSRGRISLLSPHQWTLATPPEDKRKAQSEGIAQGFGRAHLSWFSIDPLFNREHTSLTPSYIRSNPKLISSHYTRSIEVQELYPYRDNPTSQVSYLSPLNLHYYPSERGAYNLETARMDAQGRLSSPESSWAGIMRPINQSDFESNNVEYLEFWLLDPFLESQEATGGDLFINLGDISEDMLPDGLNSFEQGLPNSPEHNTEVIKTPWGIAPNQSNLGFAFDRNSSNNLKHQDVGLDGLSTQDELKHNTYQSYLEQLRAILSPHTLTQWQMDAFSPLRDPSGDNFHHYNGEDYDQRELSIIERYKYINGAEGNSQHTLNWNNQPTANGRYAPDSEDINQDNSLNTLNRYYEYRISLRPHDLKIGSNYIVASRETEVQLRNGESSIARWYQFRVPLDKYSSAVGGISDLRSMRFLRLYLSNFTQEIDLRLGSLDLVRGDWRIYTAPLGENITPAEQGKLTLSAVNIEEHGDRKPINYIVPPGVARLQDRQTSDLSRANEQALSIQAQKLRPKEAQGIYRNVAYDLRQYKRLQLFVHAEALIGDETPALDNEMELFIRLGSDYTSNYYEYTLPLKLTPEGIYNGAIEQDQGLVWPADNLLDINLEELISIKQQRNKNLGSSGSSIHKRYTQPSSKNRRHQIGILGTPSLSHVRSLMIGIRNLASVSRSIEVWVNELRLSDYNESGGWATNTQLGLWLSDLATLNLKGSYSTAGFGSLEQTLQERQLEQRHSIDLSTSIQLGKLFPEKAQVNLPIYFSYKDERQSPKYSPLDEDTPLSEALASANNDTRKQIEQYALKRRTSKSITLPAVGVGIKSNTAMPYDPANLTLNFSHSSSSAYAPELAYQNRLTWRAGINYDYQTNFKPIKPFAKLQGKGTLLKFLNSYSLNLWPSRLSLETSLLRHYEEEQLRNPHLAKPNQEPINEPTLFAHQFMWYRKLNLHWSLTPNLKFTLQTGTDARIEAPHVQTNRKLNPDGYALWREQVDKSLSELGRPQHYSQSATASYTLPLEQIKALSWINAQMSYSGQYSWELGSDQPQHTLRLGNSISNQMTLEQTGTLRLSKLYRQIPYLARLEQRWGRRGRNEQDSTQDHKASLPRQLKDRLFFSLMMLRELSISYRQTRNTYLPSFLPEIGNFFGQGGYQGLTAPGLGFALGLSTEHYIPQALQRGWLAQEKLSPQVGVYTQSKAIDLKATLTPLPNLSITLIASYNHTERQEHHYTEIGYPIRRGGDLTMTTIGLRNFFSIPKAEGGYHSPSFERMRHERHLIQESYRRQLSALRYPEQGFLQSSPWAGKEVSKHINQSLNNSAILIPAFRSSYLGIASDKGKRSPLPSIKTLLPNWSIVYNGLARLKPFSRLFRNVSLRHSYRGIYRIDSYSSYTDWVALGVDGQLGVLPDNTTQDASPRLSLPYEINSISLTESFFPLLGLDLTLRSGLTLTTQWRKSRTVNLSLIASRLIETYNNELNLGLSYRVSDIRALWTPRSALKSKKHKQGLSLRLDYSNRKGLSLIRQIESGYTQATSGHLTQRLSLSAEYELNRLITLKGYYELNHNAPLVSNLSFPIITKSYGVSLRLNLTQ